MGSVPRGDLTLPDRKGLALGGFMATGKSTVGRALAHRIGWPFVDVDDVLQDRFGAIPDQFAVDGEEAFRERERAVVEELCDGERRVVATGGGAWVDPRNRDALRRHYRLVVLTAPLAVLRGRVGEVEARPLWTDAVEQRFEERQLAYQDADLLIDTSHLGVQDIVEELLRWL